MDRMFDQKGAGQTAAEYWGYFFGAFSDKPEGSLYKSCEAKDASTAVINITRVDLELPDDPVARLVLDAVAHRAQGR